MACGNNHVSRDSLSSQPTSGQSQSSALFSGSFERAPVSERWGQMYYSQSQGSETHADTVDYFVDENGRQTFDPKRHVHVIHDEKKQEVRLVVTDRTQGPGDPHVEKVTLRGNPSAKDVDSGVQAMLSVLNSRPAGSESVQW